MGLDIVSYTMGKTSGGGGKSPTEILYNSDFKLNTTGETFWDASNSGTSSTSRVNIIDGWNIMQCTAEVVSDGLKITPKQSYAYLTNQIPAYWFAGQSIEISAVVDGVKYSQHGILSSSGFSVGVTTPFGQLYMYAYTGIDTVFTLSFESQVGKEFVVSETSMTLYAIDPLLESWDFTGNNPLVGKNGKILTNYSNGVTFSQDGAYFGTAYSLLWLQEALTSPVTIQVDVGIMDLPASNLHQRFIMADDERGLIFRASGTNHWGLYLTSWYDTSETNGAYFQNSTVSIYVDSSNAWHVYKDSVLLIETTGKQALSRLSLGSTSQSFGDGHSTIRGMRIYYGRKV